ncbi:hypothetical protein [Acidianus bottle-shaped virus]|uniref:Uncharacterized protein ORF105 n=1 Tax=Acidianus bottle-shaped virus (isolate Italy/Pozzuoli) TaxID=654911 RepID=Y105_ABVP|nr:hypothetical protein ABV_gp12 [Acidianus bottle-shaped virus]A4ZU98.1 RecName: Full=Uncharacterized protein ORF105 [Acidianus bottle-shaped virus (isolate Pozzuoli)]ABP73402.1 hypothetical protein [Acidianus bottle-shaped virus]
MICKDGFLINEENGEVIDYCYENNEMVQDKELEHYSVTPPVPYVPEKYKEKMKEYNKWLKGKEAFIQLKMKAVKKIEYLKNLCANEETQINKRTRKSRRLLTPKT